MSSPSAATGRSERRKQPAAQKPEPEPEPEPEGDEAGGEDVEGEEPDLSGAEE